MDKWRSRRDRSSGLNTWRAGCGGSRTSGSEGGSEKPTSGNAGRALRPDPYTEHPTEKGKVYCCVVLDAFSRKVVGWAIDRRCQTALVNDAACPHGECVTTDGSDSVIHSDHGRRLGFTSVRFKHDVVRVVV